MGTSRHSSWPISALLRVSSHRPWRATQRPAVLTTACGWPDLSSISSSHTGRRRGASAGPAVITPASKASSTVPPATRTVRARRQMSVAITCCKGPSARALWPRSTFSKAAPTGVSACSCGSMAGMAVPVSARVTLCSARVMCAPSGNAALSVCTQTRPSLRSRSAMRLWASTLPGVSKYAACSLMRRVGCGPATADSTALRLPCGTWNFSSTSFMTIS